MVTVSQVTRYYIIAIIVLLTVPLLQIYPAWLWGFVAIPIITLLIFDLRHFSIFFILIGAVAIYLQYHTLANREAAITLLLVAYLLKPLELNNRRDFMIIIFIGYFFIWVHFLYYQNMLMSLYHFMVFMIITVFWLWTTRQEQSLKQLKRSVRQVSFLILQAIPLMVVLFILFPRISTPLWRLPHTELQATTGLSDRMQPGAISELTLSDEIAFRANFIGSHPARSLLYWRAIIFDYFDGRSWTARRQLLPQGFIGRSSDGVLNYQITLEPHGQTWLIALEWPLTVVSDALWTGRYEMVNRRPVNARLRYTLQSTFTPIFPPITAGERAAALQLPGGGNPEARRHAQQWRHIAGSDAAYAEKVLAYIHDNHFQYTLSPPALGANSVDEFLFTTKQGFCEHYASAFTFLMRAAGIPARVVTGYQGGEYNPVGNYFIVHQYDAHAWSEIWLPMRGWVRIDPTAAAAPLRISEGLQASLGRGFQPAWLRTPNSWMDPIHLTIDAINYMWNKWILGYNEPVQRQLLTQFGLKQIDWQGLVWILSLITFGIILTTAFYLLRPVRAQRPHVVLQQYHYFCQVLARAGINKTAQEGPLDFTQRVAVLLPNLAQHALLIGRYFALLYYGSYEVNPQQVQRLQQQIATFQRKIKQNKIKKS